MVLGAAMAAALPLWAQPAPPALPEATPPGTPPAAQTAATEAPPPQADSALPWPRIEQVRRGNRVTEVRVTSGTGAHRYTMVNREGRPPLSTQELSSGLSAPRFFKLEF